MGDVGKYWENINFYFPALFIKGWEMWEIEVVFYNYYNIYFFIG